MRRGRQTEKESDSAPSDTAEVKEEIETNTERNAEGEERKR